MPIWDTAPALEIQALWRAFITQAEKAGRDCRQSLDHGDTDLFAAFMSEVAEAAKALLAVSDRVAQAAQAAAVQANPGPPSPANSGIAEAHGAFPGWKPWIQSVSRIARSTILKGRS
ncbi:hypothetical protein ACIBO5_13435 [Nonomuraea angiospora]|uniref:hypothetical protein n=1 Tax=Nonomuraea angiospora TaxID=46172 RepID=UPI0037959147